MLTRITEAQAQEKIKGRKSDEIDCDYPDCKSYFWDLGWSNPLFIGPNGGERTYSY